MRLDALIAMAAVASASTAKLYWRDLTLELAKVYATGDYDNACWKVQTLDDDVIHVHFEGGNDNPTKGTFQDPNDPGRTLNFYARDGGFDLYVQDGDGLKIGDCWKDNLDSCNPGGGFWAAGWGQCNYS